jgi:hypothetical protein
MASSLGESADFDESPHQAAFRHKAAVSVTVRNRRDTLPAIKTIDG